MHRINLLPVLIFLYSLSSAALPNNHDDTLMFTIKEIKLITSRYGLATETHSFFTSREIETLKRLNIQGLVRALLIHKTLRFPQIGDAIDFAQIITESNLTFQALEPRIERYVAQGEKIFVALEKAIEREKFHQWHRDIVQQVSTKPSQFLTKIDSINLLKDEKRRLINVYATCIYSYNNPPDRQMLSPKICTGNDSYKKPRFDKSHVSVREDCSLDDTPRGRAYRILIDEAKTVAVSYELSVFERVIMAKCMAEQSLRFFQPSHHPIKALRKQRLLSHRSPENAFFMRTGICGNFSGIAYNVAQELGLKGRIHLAKNGAHVYIEFTHQGKWFHAHPFDSKSRCSISTFVQ